jgi:hypothetical protein
VSERWYGLKRGLGKSGAVVGGAEELPGEIDASVGGRAAAGVTGGGAAAVGGAKAGTAIVGLIWMIGAALAGGGVGVTA